MTATNGTNNGNNVEEPLNRADEVNDVGIKSRNTHSEYPDLEDPHMVFEHRSTCASTLLHYDFEQ